MSETKVRRCRFGEDGIYLDAARNRYMGAISLGYGPDGKRINRALHHCVEALGVGRTVRPGQPHRHRLRRNLTNASEK